VYTQDIDYSEEVVRIWRKYTHDAIFSTLKNIATQIIA
jgi:hypothetical protein